MDHTYSFGLELLESLLCKEEYFMEDLVVWILFLW